MMRYPPQKVVLLYLAAAVGWLAFSRLVAPSLVADAYGDRGYPPLNQLLAGRTRHPLGHYLDLWRAASDAVLLALGAHFLILRASTRPGEGAFGRDRALAVAFGGSAALFLAAAVLSGPRQDYAAFLEIWGVLRRGGDPWWIDPHRGYPLNAYGPLFNLFALPASANPLAPKLLVVTAYLLSVARTVDRLDLRAGRVALAYFLGPFFWIEVAYYGHLDVLVALACVAAVRARLRGADVASGAWLGLGFLLKFMPVALLPFLGLDGRRVRPRLWLGAAAVIAPGLAISYGLWGPSILRPFAFAASRGSNLLSVFHSLGGSHSPLRPHLDPSAIDRLALPLLALAGLALFLTCLRRRVEPSTSAVLASLATLLFYKVGFPQYQMTLFLLLPEWATLHRATLAERPHLVAAACAYLGWITAFDVVYCCAGGILKPGHPWYWMEDVVGLPTFLLGLNLLAGLLRAARPR